MPVTNRGGLCERSRDKERLRRDLFRLNMLFILIKGLTTVKLRRRVFFLPRSSILKVLAILQNGEYRKAEGKQVCAHGLHEYGGYWAEGSRALQGTTGHYRALQGVKIETLTGQSRAVFGRTEKWVLALPAGLFY